VSVMWPNTGLRRTCFAPPRSRLSFRTFGVRACRLRGLFAAALVSIAACTVQRPLVLAGVPELGQMFWTGRSGQLLMTSPADLRPVYEVVVAGTSYRVCQEEGRVVYIESQDRRFRTPEGLAVGSSLADVQKATSTQPICEPGWATRVSLPSGWSAGFVGRSGCPEPLSEVSKVRFFFRRARPRV